jgi:hypothetical protein
MIRAIQRRGSFQRQKRQKRALVHQIALGGALPTVISNQPRDFLQRLGRRMRLATM